MTLYFVLFIHHLAYLDQQPTDQLMMQSILFKLPTNIIINAFFASLFDSKTSSSPVTKPPDLKDKIKPS